MAFYGQHEQKFLHCMTATVGIRYTHHETFGDRFTPKATLMYSPGAFNFRATYSAGFRAPGLDELYYHYYAVNRGKPQISFGNRNLQPEKSHYFSLNAEYHTDKLLMSVTGYYNRINDMVVKKNIDIDQTSLAMLQGEFPEMTEEEAGKLERYALYQNSDKGDVKGVQVNVSANLLRGFNLCANWAYTYARTQSEGSWSVLERSVRNTATLALNYHHAWNWYALNVNLNGRLQSKTYYTGSYEDAPGYGVWNLNTTHTFDCSDFLLEPSLGLDNIFDKTDHRIDSSVRKFALYNPGRMLTFGLRVRFKQ